MILSLENAAFFFPEVVASAVSYMSDGQMCVLYASHDNGSSHFHVPDVFCLLAETSIGC